MSKPSAATERRTVRVPASLVVSLNEMLWAASCLLMVIRDGDEEFDEWVDEFRWELYRQST